MTGERNSTRFGDMFILLAAVMWSTSGALMQLTALDGLVCNALRCAIGFFVLFAFNRFKLRVSGTILVGGVLLALNSLLFFAAINYISVPNVLVCASAAPIYVLIYTSIANKKPPHALSLIAVIAAFAGVVLVFAGELTRGGLTGNLLATASGVAFAAVFVINKRPDASPADSTMWGFIMCAATGLFFVRDIAGMTSLDWVVVAALGVFQYALAYIFFSLGIRRASSLGASLLSTVEVVLNPLWLFIFFKLSPPPLLVAGGALILLAVALNAVAEAKQKHIPEVKQ